MAPGVDVSAEDVEGVHLLQVEIDVPLGELAGGNALAGRTVYHLVVDVGEVLDVLDRVPAVLQVAPEHVEDDGPHGVAHVGRRVRG